MFPANAGKVDLTEVLNEGTYPIKIHFLQYQG